MKQAREVIELGDDASLAQRYAVLTNIDQAIAEAEKQEPVAWIVEDQYGKRLEWSADSLIGWGNRTQPLYTHPPKREWVGLDETDLASVSGVEVEWARHWEKVLKGKNT